MSQLVMDGAPSRWAVKYDGLLRSIRGFAQCPPSYRVQNWCKKAPACLLQHREPTRRGRGHSIRVRRTTPANSGEVAHSPGSIEYHVRPVVLQSVDSQRHLSYLSTRPLNTVARANGRTAGAGAAVRGGHQLLGQRLLRPRHRRRRDGAGGGGVGTGRHERNDDGESRLLLAICPQPFYSFRSPMSALRVEGCLRYTTHRPWISCIPLCTSIGYHSWLFHLCTSSALTFAAGV